MSQQLVESPTLVFAGTYRAALKAPRDCGKGPFGQRVIVEVLGGDVTLEGVTGTILTGGADWLLFGEDGYGRLDVRAQIETDDGALLYVQYFGVLEANAAVQAALANGTGTDYGDHYFRTNPRVETGDPRYFPLTQRLFVGEGHFLPGLTVEYRVYQVT